MLTTKNKGVSANIKKLCTTQIQRLMINKFIKMKFFTVLLILICFQFSIYAQEVKSYWEIDTTSNFNQANNPFTDALSMWILRQNYNLNVYQLNVGYDFSINEKNSIESPNIHYELYLPILHDNSFSVMLGTSYIKTNILSDEDNLNKSLQDIGMIWLPIQYTRNKWKFTFLYEYFLRGDNNSLYTSTGNTQRVFFLAGYNFNYKWQLTMMMVYMETEMENDNRSMSIPAFQLRYEPSKNLRMTIGAPVLFAFEWSLGNKVDIAFSQIMFDDTKGFIRYNISKKVSLSLHYNSTKNLSSDIYFKNETVSLLGQDYNFNNITQQQNAISVKVGIRTFNNLGVVFTGGYRIGEELSLYSNSDLIIKSEGNTDFFVGFNIQYLKYFR